MNKQNFTNTIYQMAVDSHRDELRRELASLLKDVRFTATEGAWIRGKEVTIWIDPRAQQVTDGFSVLITVQPSRAPKSDLEDVQLTLILEDGVILFRPPSKRLKQRGQVMFQNLPLGTYGLKARQVSPPLLLPARYYEEYYEEHYRQAVNFDTAPVLFNEYKVGDFICTVEAAPEPESEDILLSFETNQPLASDTLLRFSLVTEETDEVSLEGFALMRPSARPGYLAATVRLGEDLRFPGRECIEEPKLIKLAELNDKDLDVLRWSLDAAEDRETFATWLREQLTNAGVQFFELIQQLDI
jgi:hypothetical protein